MSDFALSFFSMHGTYTHRITCNLYPNQHHTLVEAAESFKMRLAPFIRDSALAYVDQRFFIPGTLEIQLEKIQQEIRRIGTNLNQIAARSNTLQRLTHADLRNAGKLVILLENQMRILHNVIESFPV